MDEGQPLQQQPDFNGFPLIQSRGKGQRVRRASRDLRLMKKAITDSRFNIQPEQCKAILETAVNLLDAPDDRVRIAAVMAGVAIVRANTDGVKAQLQMLQFEDDPGRRAASDAAPERPYRHVVRTIEEGHRIMPHIDSLFEVETEGDAAAEPSGNGTPSPSGNGNGKHEGNGNGKPH